MSVFLRERAADVTPYQHLRAELTTLQLPELLHRYNDARDMAQELMGLIAQHQQCTLAHVHRLLDVRGAPERRQ